MRRNGLLGSASRRHGRQRQLHACEAASSARPLKISRGRQAGDSVESACVPADFDRIAGQREGWDRCISSIFEGAIRRLRRAGSETPQFAEPPSQRADSTAVTTDRPVG
jgi:hypothetical protein